MGRDDAEHGVFRFSPSVPQRQAPQRGADPVLRRGQPDPRSVQPGRVLPRGDSRIQGPVYDALVRGNQRSPVRCAHQGCPWAARLNMSFCGNHQGEQLPPPPAQEYSSLWCAGGCGQPHEKGRTLCCDCEHKVQPPPEPAHENATERALRKLTGAPADPAPGTESDLEHGYLVSVVGADAVRIAMADADDAPDDDAGELLTFGEAMSTVYPHLSPEDQKLLLAAMDVMQETEGKSGKPFRDPEPEQDQVTIRARRKRTRRGFPADGNPSGPRRGRPRQQLPPD